MFAKQELCINLFLTILFFFKSSTKLAPHIRDFVRAYSRDWLVVDYLYRQSNIIDDDKSSLLAYDDSWIPSSRSSTHSRTSTSVSQRAQHRHTYRNDHHIYVRNNYYLLTIYISMYLNNSLLFFLFMVTTA